MSGVLAGWRERLRTPVACAVMVLLALWLALHLVVRMQAATGFAGPMAAFPDYLLALLLAVLLMIGIAIVRLPQGDRMRLMFLWVVKAAITLLVLPVYEAHYHGVLDAYWYFQTGALNLGQKPPLVFGDGNALIVWLAHWLTAVLPAYFHLLEMLWSFIGLLAVYVFYRGWRWLAPALDSRLLLWIGLFPGILFWTSIFGKDPICLLGVGLYFYGVARWYASHEVPALWWAAFGILMAVAIRSWYLVIMVAPLAGFALVGRRMRGWQKALLFVLVAAGAVFAARRFLATFNIDDVSSLVTTSNTVSHSWAHGGSAQVTGQIHGIGSMLAFIPFGMFTAFFRPLPGELLTGPALLASVENLVLVVACVLALKRTPWRLARVPWIAWLVLLLLTWGALYAFPSSQNLGTAVRFKLEMLPILWPLLLLGAVRSARWGLMPLRGLPAQPAASHQAPAPMVAPGSAPR